MAESEARARRTAGHRPNRVAELTARFGRDGGGRG
jgi:hypothetical protein